LVPSLTPDQKQSRTIVRGHILFAFGVTLFLLLAWTIRKEILILYVSALFAAVLTPIVDRLGRVNFRSRQPSRPAAIFLLIAGVALVLTIFFLVGLPPVVADLSNFVADLPKHVNTLVARLNSLPLARHLGVSAIATRAESALTATASYLVTELPRWLSHLFDILTALFLCVYFMLEGEHAYNFFLSLFPPDKRDRLSTTLKRADEKISGWRVGQGLLMLILGACSTIAFGFLHVRYFLLLGFLMGLFNIIPIAGGIFTIALAAGVAAIDSWGKMFGVLIFYIIYVNIENAFLIPRIMRSSVNLMGLTVLVSLLIGTALAGIVGALVAVPTAALLTVLLEEYAVQKA
jgi:predicted PurR-regulated permease PerM